MKQSVVYVMSGPAHMPYLIVSLWSLRAHYQGKVKVYAWPESYSFLEEIVKDERLDIEIVKWEPSYRGKNAQFFCKQQVMMDQKDSDVCLYLDADTYITGSLGPLFAHLQDAEFLVTQFNEWETQGKVIQTRVKRLFDYPDIIPNMYVRSILDNVHPSVNGGVFLARPDSGILREWNEWTYATRKIFISDETCLHALMAKWLPTRRMAMYRGGAYNCSPKFKPKKLKDDDIKIWHFHGDCNLRPNKSKRGFDMWMEVYKECIMVNAGNVSDWHERAEAVNKWFQELKKNDT